jgi:hypothetical protein
MIEFLGLERQHGWQELRKVVEQVLAQGTTDAAGVGRALTTAALTHSERPRQQIGSQNATNVRRRNCENWPEAVISCGPRVCC